MSPAVGRDDFGPAEEAVLDFAHAREAVARHARVTPLLLDRRLSDSAGREVWLKAEGLQPTGSFKVRGAASRLEALDETQRRRGVVACSSGNHGRAVAYVAARIGVPATVFVPEWVDPVKLRGIEAAGAVAMRQGESFDESEALAVQAALREGRTYVSAYDDPWVIAGQGTLAAEAMMQWREATGSAGSPAAFVVPLSGGGLIGGIAVALAAGRSEGADRSDGSDSGPLCLAASAERAAVMLASVRAGRPVELPEEETLANALAGGIGLDNRHSFELVRSRVHRHATVTEEAIAAAMRYAVRRLRLVVEGGGAVALASLLSEAWADGDLPKGPLIVVLSGANVAADVLAEVLRG
ncbi:MAG: pyridoxal-phosphate dependent enzyme [Gemmatimonadetes bacterium]|nr:pyridoxal-phosphate dependent enzyme [Gemmatimonadota bacterium]NNF12841.1 pyridoxal-phosphate dependent enzyme [Gemmatimonadota bacterium]NNL30495.1 pyridoxal-phosphate dependent enzyme [Gemmatimonadota bacterium]